MHDDNGRFTSSRQIGDLRKEKTRNIIARNFGVGSRTVERAENFVDGLNEAEKVSPGIKEAVLSGSLKAPRKCFYSFENFSRKKPLGMRGYWGDSPGVVAPPTIPLRCVMSERAQDIVQSVCSILYVGNEDTPKNKRNNRLYKPLNVLGI